jgi:hypothetical protein
MSASAENTVGRWLSCDPGLNFGQSLLVMCWFKRPTSAGSGDQRIITFQQDTATLPSPRYHCTSSNTEIAHFTEAFSQGRGTITLDTWQHAAFRYGPWNTTGVVRRMWLNNSPNSSSTWASATDWSATPIGHLRLFGRPGDAGVWAGRIAEVAIFTGLSTGQIDTVIAEAQTTHVGALSITPARAWRLHTNGLATVGGVDLTASGTITYDANDHPPVGAAPAAPVRRRLVWIG